MLCALLCYWYVTHISMMSPKLTSLQCVVGQGIIIPEVKFGAGRHKPFIDESDFANGFMLNFISQPFYLFAICLVKVSIGFFLLRVAVRKLYRRIIIGIMGQYSFGLARTCNNILTKNSLHGGIHYRVLLCRMTSPKFPARADI